MPINFDEIWEARKGDIDVASGIRRYTRAFKVQLDSRFDGPLTALNVGGLPLIGSQHNEDAGAYCFKLATQCMAEDPHFWINTYQYNSQNELSEDPLQDAATFDWDTEQYQEVMYEDEEDKASVNSAGDPFDPMPDRDNSRRVVVLEKNMESVPSWILDYQDAVNSDPFTIDGFLVGAGKAKVQRVSVSKKKFRNDIEYRTVKIIMHLDRRGWLGRYLDIGFRKIATASSTGQPIRVPIMMQDEETAELIPVTAPVLLDGSGAELEDPSFSNAVYLNRRKYIEADFNNLPLV